MSEFRPNLSLALAEMLPRLRRFARSLAGNPHDADDLVQVALERALARETQWQPEQGLDPWMYGILRNAWLDELRSRQRRWRLFAPAEAGEQVAANDDAGDVGRSVRQALARLPEPQREVVALVLVEGFSYKEAAEALAVPIGTVMSRLARGRSALQALLED